MEQWYILKTYSGREETAARLCRQKISPALWKECRVLRKIKVFRSGGTLHLLEDFLFPGYLLVKSGYPTELAAELKRAGVFPQPVVFSETRGTNVADNMIPVAKKDLHFLKTVCGENLQDVMGITRIFLNGDNQIVKADGVLSSYLNQIIKLNLHKRFAVVEVELFNRKQPVLFGIALEQDQTVRRELIAGQQQTERQSLAV